MIRCGGIKLVNGLKCSDCGSTIKKNSMLIVPFLNLKNDEIRLTTKTGENFINFIFTQTFEQKRSLKHRKDNKD